MNLRTTLVLLLFAAVGVGVWVYVDRPKSTAESIPVIAFLDKDLTADKLTRIELSRKGQPDVTLEKVDGVWTLPGKWPVREREVEKLVKTLTSLHTRFAPEELRKDPILKEADLKKLGLDPADAVTAKLTVDGKVVTLKLGEEPADLNRFTRPTYLQQEGTDEVVRLGPGILAPLKQSREYYQQRRLFPVERILKDDEGTEKIEQAAVKAVEITGPDGTVALAKDGKTWHVTGPTKDNVDPDKLRGLLVGLTDLFADRFVAPGKKLDEMGLEKPEYKLKITRVGGGETTLLIGKISESKEHPVIKPAPPQMSPFAPPPKPNVTFVKEEYRFAKLPENDQLFEIRTDKLKDVTLALADIRDPKLARFKAEDVKKVTIDHDGKAIVLVKKDDKWKLEGPAGASPLDAESAPVTDLVDKLAALEARGGDVREPKWSKPVDPAIRAMLPEPFDPPLPLSDFGLDKPAAKVTLELEETTKTKVDGATKETKTPRTLTYEIGSTAKEQGKAFVKLDGWPRVNAVADDVLKLAERDAVAYRGRKLFDFASGDIGSITVARGKDEFTLEKKDGAWSQTKPTPVKLESSKLDTLASDISRLETTEYVTAAPKAEDLDKTYGLTSPTAKLTIGFTDAKKPAKTLTIGKARPFKDDYYAREGDGPVLLLKKETVETLDRDSSSYRPAQAWQVAVDNVVELRLVAENTAFTLKKLADNTAVKKKGEEGEPAPVASRGWQLSGPFEATVKDEFVEPILEELARLKSEKYVTTAPKDGYGFEKPYLEATVVSRTLVKAEPKAEPKKDAKDDKKDEKKEEAKETSQTLIVGKLDETGKSRYAKVGDTVFLVGDKALAAVDHGPLTLLDKSILDLDPAAITNFRFTGDKSFTLEKAKDEWKVNQPEPFVAAESAVKSLLKIWPRLTATRIVAYGPKIDWAEFGLAQPKETIAVSLADKDKKATEHTIALGKELKDERFARIDQQQQVVVLSPAVVKELSQGPLDFLDTRLLKFPFDAVAGIERSMKDGDIELAKTDDGWQLVKPTKQPADNVTADDILEKTFQLTAKRIVAYKAKDLAPYGLDKPAATVTVKLTDGKKHVLAIGSATKDGERYVRVDDGDKIGLLGPELSKHLTAGPLYFADRNLASFGSADRIDLEHGTRKLVFIQKDKIWKLADPVKAPAEENLADFVKNLYRLRADEIVAGKDADLKAYGLDRPEAEWKVLAGDRTMLDLLVGSPEKGHEKNADPRRYAKLAKGDQVFLLSPVLSREALSEYRSRKPWEPSLDAAQIDQFTITGPAEPLTLMKKGDGWGLVGQPDAISTKAVTDTLDALTGLKAVRYVADQKADLQLFGLKEPSWKFEAKTPTGTRTLLVGRAEGESRRHYGAIAGQDAVFVISADDIERLTRPAASYREEKK
jgi:hypothetical protein